jgi:hypothetical protein
MAAMKLINNRISYVLYVSLGALLLLAAGCSSDPANVAGEYTLAVTNGDNGCNVPLFTPGDTASGIGMTMTQNGSSITADISGNATAVVLDAVLAKHTFSGTVDGNDLDLKIVGEQHFSKGNCTWTADAEATATIDGDVLEGQIDYTARTNEGSDCGDLVGCHTLQAFTGTRPPTSH